MLLSLLPNNFLPTVQMLVPMFLESPCLQTAALVVLRGGWDREASPLVVPVGWGSGGLDRGGGRGGGRGRGDWG